MWRGERPRVCAFFFFYYGYDAFSYVRCGVVVSGVGPYSCYPILLAVRIAERRSFLGKILNQRRTVFYRQRVQRKLNHEIYSDDISIRYINFVKEIYKND
jgi:hypothetical protein